MKKFLYFFLAILCVFLCACSKEPDTSVTDDSSSENVEEYIDAEVILKQSAWDGWGISSKTVTGSYAATLIAELQKQTETGDTEEKISDDTISNGAFIPDLPVKRGTLWVESGDTIYRIAPGYAKLCRVEEHLGKGYVLTLSDELKKILNFALNYWPYDTYNGTYENGILNISHILSAKSTVSIKVKEIDLENNHTVTAELLSAIDQTVAVMLECQQSKDLFSNGDNQTVDLKAGKAKTITLSFGGFEKSSYHINIYADNTRVDIRINP